MIIKELLDKLRYIPSNTEVQDSEGYYIYHSFGSDRGDYTNMYLSVMNDNDKLETVETVEDLISLLYDALDHGIMSGYKGGQFNIAEDTLVTLGGWGYIGAEVLDISYDDSVCIVVCDYDY